jgi:hypothetical protein
MKLSSYSYGNPKKIGRENRKTNELEFQELAAILSPRVGCHPLTTWVIWRQLKV